MKMVKVIIEGVEKEVMDLSDHWVNDTNNRANIKSAMLEANTFRENEIDSMFWEIDYYLDKKEPLDNWHLVRLLNRIMYFMHGLSRDLWAKINNESRLKHVLTFPTREEILLRDTKGMPDAFITIKSVTLKEVMLRYTVDNRKAIITKIVACVQIDEKNISADLVLFDKVTEKYKFNTMQGIKPTSKDLKVLYYLLGCSTKSKKPSIETIKSWKKKDWATRLNMFFNNRIPLDEFVPVIDNTTENINPLWIFIKDNA